MLPMSEKPPEKPTITMKAVQVPETQLDEILRTMKEVKATVGTIADDQIEMRKDVSGLREDVDGLKEREGDRSMRVRQESDVNLKQDAAVANVITRLERVEGNQETAAKERADTAEKVADVAAKVGEIRDAVVGVVTNKKVIFVGKVVFGAAVLYSGAHGLGLVP
jgi:hypothetical protein